MYPGTHAAQFPDKPAVVMAGSGATLTYGQLDEQSRRLARYWHDTGLRKGDHVALLSDNVPEVFVVYWAALRSGLYITSVNHHLAPAEVSYIVNDSGSTALVVAAGVREQAVAILDDIPAVTQRLAFGGEIPGYGSYEDALAGAADEPLPSQPAGSDMLYSSGTTGRPKGIKVPLMDRQVDEPNPFAMLFAHLYGFNADTVYLSPAPIYHAAPLRFCGFVQSMGGTAVVMERFDADDALAAIEKYRITHSQWVPTMFVRMLKLPKETRLRHDTSSLKVAIHAAAPCPVEVKHSMIDWWGPILYEYYSSTEGNGVTFIDCENWLKRPGSVGSPALGVLHICDEEGTELPAGEAGLVYFEREERPFTYHNDDEKTCSACHPEHDTWTTTGDIGYVDDDGFLFLTDRKAFMIISGGVNIYPQEIENSLALHPQVLDVAVIGVPDAEMGEAVKAVVQPADPSADQDTLAAELTEFLRERIARYKVPRSFDFTDTLPRTPTGKLAKGLLRQKYREGAR
ncbi:acyl-CoA synthetase [Mycobacteroides chelonae]|uniref:acyl-CoA synthetase n=1 Tax=Mycobacteroides chelonae TaxID=1774 RepID=UPI001C2C011B|nr:acyl-CoA synthetase [Mycobacteroides chelonae]MBV0916452.1 acyl-CoA synthetase [Mycobacteroides chelonae]